MTEISRAAQVARLGGDVVSVKDFGAVGDGVTDDTAAIQAAIDSEKVLGTFDRAGQLAFSGTYRITSPLDFTGIRNTFVIHGNSSVIVYDPTSSDDCILDFTDSRFYTLRDLKIYSGNQTNPPTFGMIMARNAGLGQSANSLIENVNITGYFYQGCLLNFAAEENTFIRCKFQNAREHKDATALRITSTNTEGYTSPFETIGSGQTSTTLNHFIGCSFEAVSNPDGYAVVLDGAFTTKIDRGYIKCGGRAHVLISTVNAAVSSIDLDITTESSLSPLGTEKRARHSVVTTGSSDINGLRLRFGQVYLDTSDQLVIENSGNIYNLDVEMSANIKSTDDTLVSNLYGCKIHTKGSIDLAGSNYVKGQLIVNSPTDIISDGSRPRVILYTNEAVQTLGGIKQQAISNGVATATNFSILRLVPEVGSQDDLDTLTAGGYGGQMINVSSNSTNNVITIKHNTGNIYTPDGLDFTIDARSFINMMWQDSLQRWVIQS